MNASLHIAPVVAGIDVGGERKGCHLVVLRGSDILHHTHHQNPQKLVDVCLEYKAVAIGIDAPAIWAQPDQPRRAERELARAGWSVFATPSRDKALANVTGFYGWMFNGERVFAALAPHYALWEGQPVTSPVCFETFPHAITSALLAGEHVEARLKRAQRLQVLQQARINPARLTSQDDIDAAICALSARYLVAGQVQTFGDVAGGFIAIPQPGNG
ncbi:DUF429 domain-containing protein [Silvimonas amylolytica]|uniref:DUF429 domain-containing protein n=1 Tax=Silvimonas amylolytica TaxID=449663 RepID=A0ABQ2PRA2_9NEIS|nr:DUF429 domain-containing protein [Silvimonas amylolytica]GGP28160.1 hypothetical protein GCM10010971_39790 [Silvimonas amylolytica]